MLRSPVASLVVDAGEAVVDSEGPAEGNFGYGLDADDVIFASVSGEDRRRRLEDVLLREVLQRLYQLHPDAPRARPAHSPPTDVEIETFANLVIRPAPEAAHEFFARMVEREYDFEMLSEGFAAPVARLLGEFWDEDRCDFLDVAFGIGRLREFIAELSGRREHGTGARAPRSLLLSTPGDTHVFAIDVIAGFLTEAGWIVETQVGMDIERNANFVANEWTHVVGVTMGSLAHFDAVRRTLKALRKTSLNPQLSILVGGACFNADRDLAVRIGADGTAPDGPTALRLAKKLWLAQTPQTTVA
jgi:methanogenic corrinoid protein MtbC1